METLSHAPFIHPVSGKAVAYSLIPDPHAPGLPLPSEIPEVFLCSSADSFLLLLFLLLMLLLCRIGVLSVPELLRFWAGPGVF